MKRPRVVLLAIAIITVAVGILLFRHQPTNAPPSSSKTQPRSKTLLMYCAAAMANPLNAVAKSYEKEYGVRIEIQFGGSGTLLSNMKVAKQGDLYLAADNTYTDLARRDGLAAETIPLARMQMVIAVKKGNPKSVHNLDDLARPELRVALANPEAASVGQQGKLLLTQLGLWTRVEAAVRERGVFKPTVNEVANDVKLGAVDAAIIWDATVQQPEYKDDLEAIEIPGSKDLMKDVTVAVLRSSTQPAAALHFARYLSARDKGSPVFAAMGFTTVEGDVWADHPKLLLYSGAVNRRAIEDTLKDFQQREGIEIITVYNGCGILNGQIRMGERPDAYQTCDASFMKDVAEQFLPHQVVSETDIVMLVKKGNPHAVHELKDLAQPGLKLGLGNEKQATLGTLTANMLKKEGIYEDVQKNVVVTTPTADMLVAQIRTGSLDAVVVYRANTLYIGEELELIPLDLPLAKAFQSFAVGRGSEHKQLAGRLFEAIRSTESQQRFTRAGFSWIANTKTQ